MARVGTGERIEHLCHQVARHSPFEPPFRRQDRPQRGARHVLEDGVEPAVFGRPGVDQAHDVRVRELGAQAHLAAEASDLVLDGLGRLPVPEAEHFDRDRLPG